MNKIFQELKHSRNIKMIFLLVISCPILFFVNCSCSMDREIAPSEETFYCDPNTGYGPINISVSTSRVNGVAPLSVFFDATGTTGLTNNCFFNNNAAYMDATFAWNFDVTNVDPGANYRAASGFVAAHVFENPGTYTVRLTVYDAAGDSASEDITITVSAFSGTPYYVAAAPLGSDFNDGSMSNPFLTPNHALTGSHVQPNTRILFRNGDTFIISNQVTVSDKTGPIIIGGYSDPSSPSLDKPIIHTTAVNSDWATIHFYNCSDIRIMNIAARATGESSESPYPRYPYGIGWAYNC
ncbi:MAG: PKD domain-containing protein, partial [Spirochaetota bacterium]